MYKDLKKLREVLSAAIEAGRNAPVPGSVCGCGRVYIVLDKNPRANSKAYRVFDSYGLRFMSRPYSSQKCIYMGYDNATGKEWYRAEAVAKVLKDNGIPCYVDGDSD